MKIIDSTWESRDGIKFFSRAWEPNFAKPKAVLALIHGLGEHIGRYTHVGSALTETGYALTGFDLRGHGNSSGTRGHFPSLAAVLQDIRKFFEQVTRRYPETPQFMYGLSLGGLLPNVQHF